MAERKKRTRRKHESFPAELQRTHKAQRSSGSFAVQPKEFAFEYTTPGPYCKVDRLKTGRCATQLNFVKGHPVIRLCSKYGDPGEVIEVSGPAEAQEKAKSFCAARPEHRLGPSADAPALAGLGRRAPQQKGNPVWLAAGLTMGIMAAVLLKRRRQESAPAGAAT